MHVVNISFQWLVTCTSIHGTVCKLRTCIYTLSTKRLPTITQESISADMTSSSLGAMAQHCTPYWWPLNSSMSGLFFTLSLPVAMLVLRWVSHTLWLEFVSVLCMNNYYHHIIICEPLWEKVLFHINNAMPKFHAFLTIRTNKDIGIAGHYSPYSTILPKSNVESVDSFDISMLMWQKMCLPSSSSGLKFRSNSASMYYQCVYMIYGLQWQREI